MTPGSHPGAAPKPQLATCRCFRYSCSLMLDLGYVREHLDVIEQMARDRSITIDLDAFRQIDAERRKLIFQNEQLKAERNKASEEVARLTKLTQASNLTEEQV